MRELLIPCLFFCSPIIIYLAFLRIFMPSIETSYVLQGASILATLYVAVIAIWKEQIQAIFVGPKLEINLEDPRGELTTFSDGYPVRFYHLKITNRRRGTLAINTRVLITAISHPSSGKEKEWEKDIKSGPLQLRWKHWEGRDQYITVGFYDSCDLGCLSKDKGFEFPLYMEPNNFRESVQANQKIRVEVQAVADNAKSDPMTLEISWDGIWPEDSNKEIESHLKISVP